MRRLTTALLLMLVAQFLFGMAVNLFVHIPGNHPGAHPAEYFSGVERSVRWALVDASPWLQLHAAFGLVLSAVALVALIVAVAGRRRGWILSSIFGFIGIAGAGFNGGSFLNYNEDVSSMLMASGMALAMVAYVLGLGASSR